MKTIAAWLAVASVVAGCGGSPDANGTSAAPISFHDRPTPAVVSDCTDPTRQCCVPYELCDQLAACDGDLLTLCRSGFDPSDGRELLTDAGAFCSIPTAWCNDR